MLHTLIVKSLEPLIILSLFFVIATEFIGPVCPLSSNSFVRLLMFHTIIVLSYDPLTIQFQFVATDKTEPLWPLRVNSTFVLPSFQTLMVMSKDPLIIRDRSAVIAIEKTELSWPFQVVGSSDFT